MPSLVDLLGTHLADVVPKLKGYVEYLCEFPAVFKQVLSASSLLGTGGYRSLNLLRIDARETIMTFTWDSGEELYRLFPMPDI